MAYLEYEKNILKEDNVLNSNVIFGNLKGSLFCIKYFNSKIKKIYANKNKFTR